MPMLEWRVRSAGFAGSIAQLISVVGEAAWRHASPRDRLPPLSEMPMFIRGLHEGLHGMNAPSDFVRPDLSESGPLAIFSDFSDRSGVWRTYSFLCCPKAAAEAMCEKLGKLRKNLAMEDGRRLEYKSLRDQKRWEALPTWLDAFDDLPGVAFVLLVHQDVLSAFKANAAGERDELLKMTSELGLGDWSKTKSGAQILEEAWRIVHCVAYLHGALNGGRSPLHWYCDNDEIHAGALRRAAVDRMLPMVVEKYSRRQTDSCLITEEQLGRDPLRDLFSIPDLLCACVLELQSGADSGATDMLGKAAVVGEWLGSSRALQKVALRITAQDDGGVWWELHRPYFQIDRERLAAMLGNPDGPPTG